MRKMFMGIVVSSIVSLGTLTPVLAATTAGESTGQTHITVDVAPGKDIKPVQPDNPNVAATDATNNGTDSTTNSGPLALVYVTKALNFGPISLKATGEQTSSVNADAGLWNKQMVVEVGDLRGTLAGWQLSVRGSQLVKQDAGTRATDAMITGAKVTFKNEQVLSSTADTNQKVAMTGAENQAQVNQDETDIQLGTDAGSQTLLKAAEGTGYGMTTMRVNPNDINLSLPRNAKTGTFTTDLTWTLNNVPQEA